MNASDLYRPSRKKARIEIIPLIDVIFFLLATFVLFTLSLDKIQGLTVKLPKVPPPRPVVDEQENTIFLQTSEGNTAYWKQGLHGTAELITTIELPARLAEYKGRVAFPRVLVRGDNKAKFGAAVAIFDEVRKAGIKEVSIETMPSSTGS